MCFLFVLSIRLFWIQSERKQTMCVRMKCGILHSIIGQKEDSGNSLNKSLYYRGKSRWKGSRLRRSLETNLRGVSLYTFFYLAPKARSPQDSCPEMSGISIFKPTLYSDSEIRVFRFVLSIRLFWIQNERKQTIVCIQTKYLHSIRYGFRDMCFPFRSLHSVVLNSKREKTNNCVLEWNVGILHSIIGKKAD